MLKWCRFRMIHFITAAMGSNSSDSGNGEVKNTRRSDNMVEAANVCKTPSDPLRDQQVQALSDLLSDDYYDSYRPMSPLASPDAFMMVTHVDSHVGNAFDPIPVLKTFDTLDLSASTLVVSSQHVPKRNKATSLGQVQPHESVESMSSISALEHTRRLQIASSRVVHTEPGPMSISMLSAPERRFEMAVGLAKFEFISCVHKYYTPAERTEFAVETPECVAYC